MQSPAGVDGDSGALWAECSVGVLVVFLSGSGQMRSRSNTLHGGCGGAVGGFVNFTIFALLASLAACGDTLTTDDAQGGGGGGGVGLDDEDAGIQSGGGAGLNDAGSAGAGGSGGSSTGGIAGGTAMDPPDLLEFADGSQLSQIQLLAPGLESEPFIVLDAATGGARHTVLLAYDKRFSTPVEGNADRLFARRDRYNVYRLGNDCNGPPVIFASPGDLTSPFVSLWKSRLDGRVFKTQAPPDPPQSFVTDSDNCRPASPAAGDFPLLLVGAAIDDQLIKKDTGLVALDDRLVLRVDAGSDGFVGLSSSSQIRFFDRRFEEACSWQQIDESTQLWHCLPTLRFYEETYSDAACQSVQKGYARARHFTTVMLLDSEERTIRRSLATADASVAAWYLKNDTCIPVEAGMLSEVGPILDPSTFALRDVEVLAGDGVKVHSIVVGGVRFATLVEYKPPGSNFFFDCEVRPDTEGGLDFKHLCRPRVTPGVPRSDWMRFGHHLGRLGLSSGP